MLHYQVHHSQSYMFKKYLPILIALLLVGTPVFALSIFTVFQGGTGRSTLPASQLIYGNGLNPVGSVATTSVTCSGSTTCTSFTAIGGAPITISSSGGSADGYGFTTDSYGGLTVQSTTTALWLKDLTPYSLIASSTLFTYASTSQLSVTGTATSTFGGDINLSSNHGVVQAHAFVADESDGLRLENNARGLVALLGAGNGLGATFYNGVNVTGTFSVLGTSLATFPYSSSTVYSSFITASTTNLSFGGVTGDQWSDFCTSITGGAGLCDGSDDGGAGTSAYEIATTSSIAVPQLAYFTNASGRTTLGGIATSSLAVGASITSSGTLGAQVGGTASSLSLNMANANTWTALQTFANSTTTYGSFVTASTTDAYFGTGQGIAYIGSGGRLRTTATSTFSLSQFTNDLANLTALDTSLTFSGSYNGSVARTVGLNTGRTNTWSVLQNFNYSSSTAYSSFLTASSTNLFTGFLTLSTTTAGTLKVSNTGIVWSDTSAAGGGYATIQDEGSGLTARSILNFTGSGVNCVDNAGSTRTDCTINAGAATAGGSDTQVQFNDATSLGGAVGWIWNKTKEIMGVGTTTPWTNHKVSIATSTGQQLSLLSGLNDNGFAFRSVGGSLYIGTTSPLTGATSTTPILSLTSGQAQLNIGPVITFPNNLPYLHIATSTTANFGDSMFHVNATTTTLLSNTINGKVQEIGVRVGIGLWNYKGYGGLLDQLTVRGRFNTDEMLHNWCDIAQFTALSADGIFTSCPGWLFNEDNTATGSNIVANSYQYTRVSASTAAVNYDGAGVFFSANTSTGWFTLASSTPVLEVNYRIRNSTATTTNYVVGFSNININGGSYEFEPSAGCFFIATSTTANWIVAAKTSTTSVTYFDTGIASTSSNAANGTGYKFRLMRIQGGNGECEFFMQDSEANMFSWTSTTNVPSGTLLNAGMHYGIVSQNTNSGFDFFRNRFWWKDMLPSL